MSYIKLQLGCLIVCEYLCINYIKNTRDKKIKCNRLFDSLMIFSTVGIFFDGLTSWTVNHLEIVPPILNLIFHLIFFLSMEFMFFSAVLYMLNSTKGIPVNPLIRFILYFPFCLCIFFVFLFCKDLNYVQGKITNYSMGKSVIVCYLNCIIYFVILFVTSCLRIRYIEKQKRFGLFALLFSCLTIFLVQIFIPEVLVTSIISVLFIFGIYLSFEDPALQKLKDHNSKTVTGFATLVENRDNNTGGHIIRTKAFVQILLEKMKWDEMYIKIVTKDYEENMLQAAPMHDIGKISTPDEILKKPGKLTDEEFSIMKLHAENGGEIIKKTFSNLDNPEFLEMAYKVARFHHEKWNGLGYPEGLKENEIPLCARIMSIADVFDAISADRCYRAAMPLDKCFKIIEEGAGKDFDPNLVRLFMKSRQEIEKYFDK